MKDLTLILCSLRSRWLGNLLSSILAGFGFMLALVVLIFGHHVQMRMNVDGQEVDIVIGAKGSPLQLVLSTLYHLDIPTGNITYKDAQKWMHHPQVDLAIPLALGDSWHGLRIVGTTPDYVDLYKGRIAEGRLWTDEFEVVTGSGSGLRLGAEFAGSHGLSESGHEHHEHLYRVVGVLAPTGTVLDRLILTSVNSVLELHGQHDAHEAEAEEEDEEHDHEHNHAHHGDLAMPVSQEAEITALLIRAKGPLAQMNLPRAVNRESALQAASPAYEITRLSRVFGLGSGALSSLSAVLVMLSAFSVFAGLAGSLSNRAGDLAVLRTLGYGQLRLAVMLASEGGLIASFGLIIGTILGYAGFQWALSVSDALRESGAQFDLSTPGVVEIAAFIILAGLCSAIIPAWKIINVDVSRQLSGV